MGHRLRLCRRMSRRVPPRREEGKSSPVYLSVARTQSSFPCNRVRSPILPNRFYQVCAFSLVTPKNSLRGDHHLNGFPIIHRAVTVRNAVKSDGTIKDSTGLDLALKNVRQKLLDISPHWSTPAADHDIVVKCWLGSWNRLFLRNADAPHGATRTSDTDRGIHRLLKPDAFQH